MHARGLKEALGYASPETFQTSAQGRLLVWLDLTAVPAGTMPVIIRVKRIKSSPTSWAPAKTWNG
jgi:hypothetical protein